jgi:hypothetical protein
LSQPWLHAKNAALTISRISTRERSMGGSRRA